MATRRPEAKKTRRTAPKNAPGGATSAAEKPTPKKAAAKKKTATKKKTAANKKVAAKSAQAERSRQQPRARRTASPTGAQPERRSVQPPDRAKVMLVPMDGNRNPLDAFLNEIKQYPLLDPDEEKRLAEEYQRTGDPKIAATLVTSNLRLVVKIAFEYRRAYRHIMDLVQEGNVGLMHAVRKFDPAQGVKLSSYAAWWIRAYILRFILSNWRLVKLGTTQAQRKLFFNLNKERQRLKAMGIEPTTEVLAERLLVKKKEITEMERRMQSEDLSLDAEIGDGTGRVVTRGDMLASEGDLQDDIVAEAAFQDEFKFHLEIFGKTLTGKEAVIFRDRLMSDSPRTLQEIGEEFNVSRERIRQIEKRLLRALRHYLEEQMSGYFSDGAGL